MVEENRSYQAKEAQLMSSLKFHHSKTLSEIPLEVAVRAIAKVWESCQESNPHQSSVESDTLVWDRQNVDWEIHFQS